MSFTSHAVLFEDEDLILVDKPAGVLSHPNPGQSGAPALAAFLGKYDFNAKTFSSPAGKLWLLHRLDQDTSGVLLAAKHADCAGMLREQFESGRISKHYLALVRGMIESRGAWKDHLVSARDGGKVRVRTVRGRPENAELRFKAVDAFPEHKMTLLEIELLTGKTHQIRVQSASRQHPLAHDDLYGDFGWNRRLKKELGLKRLFLHAARLELVHPRTRRRLRVNCPLPIDLSEVIQRMSAGATSRS